jgi:rhamnogalacturonan endolyase
MLAIIRSRAILMIAILIGCAAALPQIARGQRIEVETTILNHEATTDDVLSDKHWCIWRSDKDADKKWSGGVVVRGPIVREDRQDSAEGAPPLHCRIPVPEPGLYSLSLFGSQRPMGVSLDGGKTWRRFTQGTLASALELDSDHVDCFFDDRFAAELPAQQGASYLDYFILERITNVKNHLSNPDFEAGEIGKPAPGWSWWHREKLGQALLSKEADQGQQALHITSPEGRDWNCSNAYRMAVIPNTEYRITARAKTMLGNAQLAIVGLKNGQVVTWQHAVARLRSNRDWHDAKGFLSFTDEDDLDEVYLRIAGNGAADILIDDIAITPVTREPTPPRPPVQGFASTRVREAMDRGLVAMPDAGAVYLSWRLLKEDPQDIAFNVLRIRQGRKETLNAAPIRQTCDFVDLSGLPGDSYEIHPLNAPQAPSGKAMAVAREDGNALPYLSYKISDPKASVQKVGVGDLNGDGAYDFVVKHPSGNVDPWSVVWYPSPETYKLEAILSDGTILWTKDLGWAIERGIWYSPFVVHDFTGDGKAEIALKLGEGDPRDADGKVTSGAEWLVVWDGMSGDEIARAPWPERDGFESYNLASRNQIMVAYLDGKTPCIIALRGTYGYMLVEAWQLKDGNLERLWTYSNEELPSRYWGQGAHTNYAADIDGDGRDEVILGSAVIDDNGLPLWTTGKGHPDGVFVGKLRPDLPGLQVAYIMETRQRKGGLCMADALTGKMLWELDTPTSHVDGKGTCANLDPRFPGCELAGADMAILEPGTNKRGLVNGWLFNAQGELLYEGKDMPYRFGTWTVYWDADLQKELIRDKIVDPDGYELSRASRRGSILMVADVIGDWREEIFCGLPGELRIYTTTLPAMDRRPCLMQEHNYRMRIASNAMGYPTEALLPYDPESESPNLNLTYQLKDDFAQLRIVAVASQHAAIDGQVTMEPSPGVSFSPASFPVKLQPGERLVTMVTPSWDEGYDGYIKAQLDLGNGTILRGQVYARAARGIIKNAIICEAEKFSSQSGGSVQIRDDKANTSGKSISHWDPEGHTLAWEIDVPKAGKYHFFARYCNLNGSKRRIRINEQDLGICTFPGTGGYGGSPLDWDHFSPIQNGLKMVFDLQAGKQRVVMENTDGIGNNLDYIAFKAAE